MKNILYLTFYFEPDLCAGSFRNSPLAKELVRQLGERGNIDLITTVPNRYSTYDAAAPAKENRGNLHISRVLIPKHQSGFSDQINSFKTYYQEVKRLVKGKKYDMVFASSSRLFTAYLGYTIAKKQNIPLYLDIRDIFIDTMEDVLQNSLVKAGVLPVLRQLESRVFNYATHINLISGGFKPYFEKYQKPSYSTFPNGIDPEFLNLRPSAASNGAIKLITYAGNIGEGQGLHKIIPQAAKQLEGKYQFVIVGDGGAKAKLLDEMRRLGVTNVDIRPPVPRKELLELYDQSDFLFLHLNDYEAFKKVLPSKIFELGAYDKPIIAGVAGFANQFIAEHIPNKILFLPGDVRDMVDQLSKYTYQNLHREEFLKKFKREAVNQAMSASILNELK